LQCSFDQYYFTVAMVYFKAIQILSYDLALQACFSVILIWSKKYLFYKLFLLKHDSYKMNKILVYYLTQIHKFLGLLS
jgi:hypothetical protein